MQSDLKTNCVGRRPLICLFAESLPTQVLPQHLANYDFVCVKKNDNLFEVLEDRMPDVFISFKPTQPQEEMETLPLLVRRMWFEFDQLSPKIFAKIYNILCKRQLKCYLVRNSKDVSLNNGMIEVITPQAFLAHHTNQLEINFEFCFFLDKGLEKDPHMQTFYKKIWPNLSRLRGFCRASRLFCKLLNKFFFKKKTNFEKTKNFFFGGKLRASIKQRQRKKKISQEKKKFHMLSTLEPMTGLPRDMLRMILQHDNHECFLKDFVQTEDLEKLQEMEQLQMFTCISKQVFARECFRACRKGSLAIVQLLIKYVPTDNLLLKEDLGDENIFDQACSHGHGDLAKWLLNYFKVEKQINLDVDEACDLACENGHLEIVQLCLRHSATERELDFLLQIACEYGHLEIAKWMVVFWTTEQKNDLDAINFSRARVAACETGQLHVVQWLMSFADEDEQDVNYNQLLNRALQKGHLEVAKWIWNFVATEKKCYALSPINGCVLACTNGHLAVVQWVYEIQQQNGQQNINMNMLLEIALEKGHVELVKWFIQLCPMIQIEYHWRFLLACMGNHLQLAKWLWTFLTNEEKCDMNSVDIEDMQKTACRQGKIDIVQWCFGFQRKDHTPIDYYLMFSLACNSGHLELAKWLRPFLPSDENHAYYLDLFENARYDDKLELAEWLQTTFDLVTEDDEE